MAIIVKNLNIFFTDFCHGIYHSLINVFFPNYCIQCKGILSSNENGLCKSCFLEIPRLFNQLSCKICSSIYSVDLEGQCFSCRVGYHKKIYYTKAFSCFSYINPIRELIQMGKFKYRHSVWKIFIDDVVHLIENKLPLDEYLLIPVPISNQRRLERGFNQSEILCKNIYKLLKIPYNFKILFKIKNNNRQSSLSGEERINNPLNCYRVANHLKIVNKNILLIDDVYTTGSTINECSRVLSEYGVKTIHCITIAKRDLY